MHHQSPLTQLMHSSHIIASVILSPFSLPFFSLLLSSSLSLSYKIPRPSPLFFFPPPLLSPVLPFPDLSPSISSLLSLFPALLSSSPLIIYYQSVNSYFPVCGVTFVCVMSVCMYDASPGMILPTTHSTG